MRIPLSHEKKVGLRYNAELFAGLLVYVVILCVSLRITERMHSGIVRTLVSVSPSLALLLVAAAIIRGIKRMDEYMRLVLLQNIAVSAGVTAIWTFTYGFLENVGYPRLSMFTVWPSMGAVWFILGILRFRTAR